MHTLLPRAARWLVTLLAAAVLGACDGAPGDPPTPRTVIELLRQHHGSGSGALGRTLRVEDLAIGRPHRWSERDGPGDDYARSRAESSAAKSSTAPQSVYS